MIRGTEKPRNNPTQTRLRDAGRHDCCNQGVEQHPEPGIYLHLTVPTDFGFRIVEIWDRKEGFEEFAERRMYPALQALGIERETVVTIRPLHNLGLWQPTRNTAASSLAVSRPPGAPPDRTRDTS